MDDNEFFKEFLALPTWEEFRGALRWPSTRMLLAANLSALAGVLFAGWSVAFLLVVYWAETLVIGAYTMLKMFVAAKDGSERVLCVLLWIVFILHFGAFMAGHGAFIALFVTQIIAPMPGGPSTEHVKETVLPLLADPWLRVAVVVMVVSHGVSFVKNVIHRRDLEPRSPSDVMLDPYRRVLVMHIVIIVGAVPVLFIGSSSALALVLVLLKTVSDIGAHAREHALDYDPDADPQQ